MALQVESLDSRNLPEARRYLSEHEDSVQFLINNLKAHGPALGDHPNSGNFKLIRDGATVRAVFCLSRRGNLIAHARCDCAREILRACEDEPLIVKGFIGDWSTIAPVYELFKAKHPEYTPTTDSKEILYSFALRSDDTTLRHDSRVRFLDEPDFPQWRQLRRQYDEELSLPHDLTPEQARDAFLAQTREKSWWGLFEGSQLRSQAALNSKGDEVGQVGGVFTPKRYRRRGYAKAVMLHLLKDCRDLHGHRKSLLFTGESDIAAQALYEAIGYRRIGSFALILRA